MDARVPRGVHIARYLGGTPAHMSGDVWPPLGLLPFVAWLELTRRKSRGIIRDVVDQLEKNLK